jgi:hypothetical protein
MAPEQQDLPSRFRAGAAPSAEDYGHLFAYFLRGYLARRSASGATARYPGMFSANGRRMDCLEGFSRIAPLLAAWIHGGRPTSFEFDDGRRVDLVACLRDAIVAGTDPSSPEYWGDIRHWGQAIVEAADIALVLWLTRDALWRDLDAGARGRIGAWLAQVEGKRIPDNNWHLFVAQVGAVLGALGQRFDGDELQRHYQRARSFYRGAGWFEDGAMPGRPSFDYYNAWGFHYQLQWLTRIDPGLDARFIDESLAAFVASYKYFFGPRGFPIMGRSVCYRMAAPVPLVFAQAGHGDIVSPGEARRALDVTWQYFIGNGALKDGNVTQGYFGDDARLLENYSGPASCLWSLRSLVAAFALPPDDAFWRAAPEPLPVERGDFEIRLDAPGWVLVGERRSASITVRTGHGADPPLQPHRLVDRIVEQVTRKPRRPKNHEAKYYRSQYASDRPFCVER